MISRWNNSSALLSVAAVSALALTSCASDELNSDDDDAQPTATVTETVEAEATEETTDEATEDATADAEPTEDPTGSPEAEATETDGPQAGDAEGDDPLYQAVDAVKQEYPEAVVLDFDTESSYYEFTILDGGSEWELDVDRESFEISNTQEDDLDSDDQRNADAVEIEFADALRTAAEEGGGTPEQAELDDENGAVTWEIELDNGTEVYVDVATGEVANGDD
ncbi:PepSY domain-containing protein [Nesterenkonia sp. E16_7]|uniref:PepSY domain-containing protein n=1 Tax=unclassified Nesterenkonia TaxID=2629769 RepID=UPI001A914D2D|nr:MULTISPECIES: PepSY domain-containing protein [unclassified Nesterenkonia]MBO0595045.1 PepSY domain-containing protein [Nesterenkonia sp. E16_10]MBO0598700.1 PepSY domain-containing protein [Nesterenkonia sp. E16_7]